MSSNWPSRRASPTRSLALLATLVLGACALVPVSARCTTAAAAIVLALSVGATSWGVYATLASPEAGLAGSPIEALLSLPRVVPPSAHGLIFFRIKKWINSAQLG